MSSGGASVLHALRRAGGGVCSGEALSSDLGVSRSQVWKHVQNLRSRGYEIEGAAGGGYRLVSLPDRLYPELVEEGLTTRWLGRQIHYVDETDSTNDLAHELARAGAPHGLAVLAEGQSAGRGRLGRSFFSPPYVNLYTSLVLRPELSTASCATAVLASATAVAECVAEELGERERVQIKWPNDVLIDGQKTSGILMELAAEATRVAYLVLGIGINLNVDPEQFPEEIRAIATSVAAAAGRSVDRLALVQRLFGLLEELLDLHQSGGLAAIRPRFDAFFRMHGRTVQVRGSAADPLEATVVGIAEDGALVLRDEVGRTHSVLAGDVSLSGSPGA